MLRTDKQRGRKAPRKERDMMNVLDYINELIENGYSEEDAEMCADYMFSDEPDYSEWGDDNV